MPVGLSIAMSVLIVIVAVPTNTTAQEIHADHCMYGCPDGSPESNDLIIRSIYILSSNDTTKFADWVAYRVTKDSIGRTQKRVWRADPWLADNETLEPEDYKGAFATLKTDRGHQAPLASFTNTPNWELTNYLSNITPQKSALNQGSWVKLENAVRTLAKKPATDAVYVMTGPLYEREMPALPNADESHRVPSGYWKTITIKKGETIKIAAFRFDQETDRKASFCNDMFVTDVRTIERQTGLDFFHDLTQAQQDKIETGPASLLTDLGCSS